MFKNKVFCFLYKYKLLIKTYKKYDFYVNFFYVYKYKIYKKYTNLLLNIKTIVYIFYNKFKNNKEMETKYKTWCKKCKDFTLHTIIPNTITSSKVKSHDNYICDKCNLNYTNYTLDDVPFKKFDNFLTEIVDSLEENEDGIINENGIEYNCMYDIYFLKLIEMINNKQSIKHLTFISEPKINRNDLCLCGSGKKFKKCCLNKI
jgi:hypothetical protein